MITVESIALAEDTKRVLLIVVARGTQIATFLPRDTKVVRVVNGQPVRLFRLYSRNTFYSL
jgi:hypothetical protein